MNVSPTDNRQSLRAAIERICARFGDDYWLARDRDGGFTEDFHRAFAEAGFLGICIPEEYGGSSLGITDAAAMMQAIAESGAGFSGASAIHMNIFGLNPVVVFGSAEQKDRFLPPLIAGKEKACFAVTEPDAGLDTTHLTTRAVRAGADYIVSGRKVWISTAQVADKMLILTRTTPLEATAKPTDGLTLFYTNVDRDKVEIREIAKMGRTAVDSNMLFIDGLRVPESRPHRRRGRGVQIHSARHEPGADPDRRRGDRAWPGGASTGLRLCRGTRRLRPQDRAEPGNPAPACAKLDGIARRRVDDARCRRQIRSRRAVRGGGECRQISCRRGRLPCLRDGDHDAWRLRLRARIPRRALSARNADRPHRADHAAPHSLPHRREGAGPAALLLTRHSYAV